MNIEEIAGRFLGNNSRYETPNAHDKNLLVKIPREFNRTKENINVNTFIGFEVWHCYEFSFLKPTGMPTTGILKISYSAVSPFIVESKSLKLYTNSFDLEKFDNKKEVESIIANDLSELLETPVSVTMHLTSTDVKINKIFRVKFENIDDMDINISHYKEEPLLLTVNAKLFDTPTALTFHTANLRSNCEITNQKDTGNCYIYIKGLVLPNIISLSQYIISMRESQHFHENVTEIIYTNIMKNFQPTELFVCNLYNRRGGIDIHSIRANNNALIRKLMNEYNNTKILHEKTMQQ